MAEPIAVIGLDAKLPCDGDSVQQFFEFLVAGRSARKPVPSDRYNADAFWHPDHHRDGIIASKEGHFMSGSVKAFDAPFFGITPAEAAALDPQQRLLLESSYAALENAGYTLNDILGSNTGVYTGSFVYDYRDVTIKDTDVALTYSGTGSVPSTLAGRVAWFYDFRGPAFTVDTACSSSMVALHQAVIGLKSRECNLALACGTNVILSPEFGQQLNGLGVLSPQGASKSFDKEANGYGRGEGISVVVLKRMSDAIRDGDTIRAVIRNSGIGHDGKGAPLPAPVRESQANLVRRCYAQAKVDPSETRMFEAHGTGTNAGDPTEAGAISDIFSRYRSEEEPIYIGALKSNIGHTEGNSGIASFIKAVLTLESGIIPANAHFKEVNHAIPKKWHFKFPTAATPFPKTASGVRRISINSFGISGTNAHVVLEDARHFLESHGCDAPHRTIAEPRLAGTTAEIPAVINGTAFTPQLLVFSAFDQDGVSRMCKAYAEYLPKMTDSLYNLSYTLASKRSRFSWRAAVVASSGQSLEDKLSEGQPATRSLDQPGLGFVFTGQGAQWALMGTELMQYLAYRQSVECADAYLKTLGCEWSVIDELSKYEGESRINNAEFSQALCTVVQVALVDLLADWGVKAQAAAGHSSGEIAAAYSAGAIDQESAWRIAYWRGKLSVQLAASKDQPKGAMAAVGLDSKKTLEAIDKVNESGFQTVGKLTIACMNSENNHTVSGDVEQIDALVQMLGNESVFARKLKVEMAYHSRYMEPIVGQYTKCMGKIIPRPWNGQQVDVQFFSSTYGTKIDHSKLREPAYWTTNLVSTVRFNESLTEMLKASSDVKLEGRSFSLVTDVIEIGPHSALQGPLRNIIDGVNRGGSGIKYHHTLKRGDSDVEVIMQAAGTLFTRGIEADLLKINHVEGTNPILMTDLPRYQFNHSREYWSESRLSRNFRFRTAARHELLGAPVTDWDAKHDAIWRNWIRLSENPWVEHHAVSGAVLYPAAGMLVMAIEACKQLAEISNPAKVIKAIRFREVSFHSALQVPDNNLGVESHLHLRPVKQAARETKTSPWREFQVLTAQEDDQFREHCCGQVLVEYEESTTAVDAGREDQALRDHAQVRISDAQQKCKTQVTPDQIYRAWKDVGLLFGPTFQTLSESAVDHESGVTFATIKPTVPLLKSLMPLNYLQPHLIHPTTLDGALQACLVPLVSNPTRKQNKPIVLSFIEELWISASTHPEEGYQVFADYDACNRNEHTLSCTAIDTNTKVPMIRASGCRVTEVDGGASTSSSELDPKHKAWHIRWKADTDFADFGAETEGFQKYLDALAHKNPHMKFLDISNGAYTFTNEVLTTLAQRYGDYDLTDSSISSLNEIQKKVTAGFVQPKVLDIMSEPMHQGFKYESYDVLVAPVGAIPNAHMDIVLRRFYSLLKPGGKIVLTVPFGKAVAKSWAKYLAQQGFSERGALFGDKKSSVLIASVPATDSKESVVKPKTYYVVADQASEKQRKVAEKLESSLKENGVAVKIIALADYEKLATTADQEAIADSACIMLPELEKPLLATADQAVLSALKKIVGGKRLLWANKESPDTDLVTGFAGSIRLDLPKLEFVTLTFQPEEGDENIASKILEVDTRLSSHRTGAYETSYKVIDGSIMIARLIEAPALTKHVGQISDNSLTEMAFGADPTRPLRLKVQQIGSLNSSCFVTDHLYAAPLNADQVEFKVKATGMNFKDLAIQLGMISESAMGLEAAGIVTRVGSGVTRFKPGDRVFGFTYDGSFTTYARTGESILAKIPDNLSFAQTAIIPVVYLTAWICLYEIGGLARRTKRGKKPTVLIHVAAGGVGQAAIQLAQREGAEIFVTVGSIEKRDLLEKVYGIQRDHIFSSRDLTFKTGVLRMTANRGVDIVINSLAGDALRASWELVAPFGAFAEIGLTDIESRARISMATFARGVRFESLELAYMWRTDPERLGNLWADMIEDTLGRNLEIKTLITSYPVSQMEEAMRLIQSAKHIGKLVIEYHDEDVVRVIQPPKQAAKLQNDATYVISGGFGGLGLEIIRWLVQAGAKNLIVPSRRGPSDEASKALVAELQGNGIQIATPSCDITDKAELEKVISKALAEMPPVRGCIQSSAVFADNAFDKMTAEQWHQAVDVKVKGSQNLWDILTSTSKTLDFFIMLSSLVGNIGMSGQVNYCAGNSYQNAMARSLASQGHNVVALAAPVLDDAGMVAERPALRSYLLSTGLAFMSSEQLVKTLDYYCHPGTKLSVEEAQSIPRFWLPRYTADEGAEQPAWQHEPMYNHMVLRNGADNSNGSSGNGGSSTRSTPDLIAAVTSLEEAEQTVLKALLNQLTKTLSYDLEELDADRSLNAYGVDSLVAVELRLWMTKEIGADVSVFDFTNGQSIGQLAAKAAAKSRFLPEVKGAEKAEGA
ncbi:hypothetical protein COCCADRAFT_6898 [Bipolaris zeicola 26-R-13]|uniref:Uncharacterized protein n=1 Tax=Cochliobolus carbonum (strain 26-R-13) TaxID=930089 RepID=W6Y7D6_COCC2|nr:uncharacterized protein COCCADRAFT_6898 [Bipolaris zeicola 26-R-13]EUC31174.1 hypothetical protein COCCADRAFT_6898 [Bipolaris zeicola 26-R-13]